jgi:hypothetical protein
MASQQRVDRTLDSMTVERAGASSAYITILIGYVLTVVTTPPHLTQLNFIAFTVLQLIYCAVLWWLIKNDFSENLRFIVIVMLTMLTVATGLLSFSGLQWDWLLYLVTVAIFFLALSLRVAIVSGVVLYLFMVINLSYLDNWNWSQIYPNLLTLLPAFLFVAIFSNCGHI